jgi:hypothetical protein
MQGNIKEKVSQVLQNFSTVFQENLGSVTGIQAPFLNNIEWQSFHLIVMFHLNLKSGGFFATQIF